MDENSNSYFTYLLSLMSGWYQTNRHPHPHMKSILECIDEGYPLLLHRVALAFLFRIGSILIQVGSIPVRNINLILVQNIVELTTSTATFFVFGYTIAFGNLTEQGLRVGSLLTINDETEIKNAIYAWAAISTTTAIFTTMTAGRMHFVGYVLITALLSGLIEPLAMNWVWTPGSFVRKNNFLRNEDTSEDFGCISHVHLLAGTAAFLATIFLGRRSARLKDTEEASLASGAKPTLTLGYFLTIVGTFGLFGDSDYKLMVGMKCGLAVIGGVLAAMTAAWIINRRKINYWKLGRYLQGGLAGMVVLSNGMAVYPPLICLMVGALGGICFYITHHLLFKTPIEDYCNVMPVHFFGGIASVLLSDRLDCLFGKKSEFLSQFAGKISVNACLVGFYIACLVPVFLVLALFGFLRNNQPKMSRRRAMKTKRTKRNGGFSKTCFPRGPDPKMLVPECAGRREEYQDQLLSEKLEVALKPDRNPKLWKRREEYEDQRLSEKLEVALKSDRTPEFRKIREENQDQRLSGKLVAAVQSDRPEFRKIRVEDDDSRICKKPNHNDWEEIEDFSDLNKQKSAGDSRNVEMLCTIVSHTNGTEFKKSRKLKKPKRFRGLDAGTRGIRRGTLEKFLRQLNEIADDIDDRPGKTTHSELAVACQEISIMLLTMLQSFNKKRSPRKLSRK